MDDHIYDEIMSYAECSLLPEFREEYKIFGKLSACPSYKEVKALCDALNVLAPYAGYARVAPRDLIETE